MGQGSTGSSGVGRVKEASLFMELMRRRRRWWSRAEQERRRAGDYSFFFSSHPLSLLSIFNPPSCLFHLSLYPLPLTQLSMESCLLISSSWIFSPTPPGLPNSSTMAATSWYSWSLSTGRRCVRYQVRVCPRGGTGSFGTSGYC